DQRVRRVDARQHAIHSPDASKRDRARRRFHAPQLAARDDPRATRAIEHERCRRTRRFGADLDRDRRHAAITLARVSQSHLADQASPHLCARLLCEATEKVIEALPLDLITGGARWERLDARRTVGPPHGVPAPGREARVLNRLKHTERGEDLLRAWWNR